MNIRKLPSGSYQVRKQYKGQTYSFTLDHKPTQKELVQLLANAFEDDIVEKGTLEEYMDRYIKSKENVLSPSTIRGYRSIVRNMGDIKYMQLNDINSETVQREVNQYKISHSPKSTKNLHGFISAVLRMYRPALNLHTTLPQDIKEEPYIPSDEEVKRILDYAKGSEYEVALWLAVFGLRRGEIAALTIEDLSDDNMLTVNKSLSEGENGRIIKEPKTPASIRTIAITPYVADKIREQGYVYKYSIQRILKYLHKAQDDLGIQRFKLHHLRHYFASTMSSAGVSENDLLKMGGWATPNIMKSVYRHSMMDKDKEAKREIAEKLAQKLA